MAIKVGDTVVYTKTGTTGKVLRIISMDNRLWAELDSTELLYEETVLEPSDASTMQERKEKYEEEKKKRRAEEEPIDVKKEMKDEGTLDTSAGICGAG